MPVQLRKSTTSACCLRTPSTVPLKILRSSAKAEAPGRSSVDSFTPVSWSCRSAWKKRTDCRGEQVWAQRAALEHAHALLDRLRLSVGGVAHDEGGLTVEVLAHVDVGSRDTESLE
ncbi:hypothetical protein Pcac1_g29484 [Phytophthora cactorum]|nr:hypothetical protein Pcac1_g29484 [Phytophthora cactorum]